MKTKKKILIFSHEFPPCLGGAGSVAFSLKKCLEKKEYEVTVLTSRRTHRDPNKNINTISLPNQLWFLGYRKWLRKHIYEFDLIICNDPAAIYNAGAFFSREQLRKTICFIHGEEKYLYENKIWLKLIKFKKRFLQAVNNSKTSIFVSEYIRARYYELYDLEKKINQVVIHSGVELKERNNNSYSKNSNNIIKFLSVSRIVKGKGYDKMFEVFLKLSEEIDNFEWNIIGDGSYLAEFKRKVSLSTLKDKVFFHGAVRRDRLPDFYVENDYFILLSELNESYGLSYLEAASFGLPTIGYNRAGVPEAFSHITKSLLLDYNKKTHDLSADIQSFILNSDNVSSECLRSEKEFISEVEKYV